MHSLVIQGVLLITSYLGLIWSILNANGIEFLIFILVLIVIYIGLFIQIKNNHIKAYVSYSLIMLSVYIFYIFSYMSINIDNQENYFSNISNNKESFILDIEMRCDDIKCINKKLDILQKSLNSKVQFKDFPTIGEYIIVLNNEITALGSDINFPKIQFNYTKILKKSLYNTTMESGKIVEGNYLLGEDYIMNLSVYNYDTINFFQEGNQIDDFKSILGKKYPRNFWNIFINKKYAYEYTYYSIPLIYSHVVILKQIEEDINKLNNLLD